MPIQKLLFPSLFAVCLLPLLTVPSTSVVFAHEGPAGHSHKPTTEGTGSFTATGIVYEDLNGNRMRDPDEPGLPKIRVSNGADIVATDADGKYELTISDDAVVFVIKPSGWATPLNANNLPQFYYIHKPAGSPPDFQFAGVAPTGPLPESIDFPLTRQAEPQTFKVLMFGDPQPRDLREVEFIAHDVIEQIVLENAHDASFGVTLGDIAFNDLDTFGPLNQAIALIGIPWYNVIGNHDLNFEAVDDQRSDETFERVYGPNYYSFDYGSTHFLVLDDVTWVGATEGEKGHYYGGLGERQMEFIRNDLAAIPEEQLVVLMMHIPLTDVQDRHELYRLIEQRPAAVSISAHAHYMEHRLIDAQDDWQGPEPHHHIVNVTVCGSWWRGQPDERGIPHTTMKDGAPNGYSIMEFDGRNYSMDFRAAGRPASYQMNIYAPEIMSRQTLTTTVVLANVFAAGPQTVCELRVGDSPWVAMERLTTEDPNYVAETVREAALGDKAWVGLPAPRATPHMYRGLLPTDLAPGTHQIEIRASDLHAPEVVGTRIFRLEK